VSAADPPGERPGAFHTGTDALNIWRVDADGSNPKQLTTGRFDTIPFCSPDGKWVYYHDADFHLMRVLVGGFRVKKTALFGVRIDADYRTVLARQGGD